MAAAKQQEAIRQESVKQELAKQEALRQEAAKLEAARQVAAQQELARQEVLRQESARQEAARLAAARQQEAARQESARQELAKQEALRQEVARTEAARQETLRQEALRQAAAKQQELARQEALANAANDSSRKRTLIGRPNRDDRILVFNEIWRRWVAQNVPFELLSAAKTGPYTNPRVTVVVRKDGSVESITFNRSSGIQGIDDVIRQAIMALPRYASMPAELTMEYDTIEVSSDWTFSSGLRLLPAR